MAVLVPVLVLVVPIQFSQRLLLLVVAVVLT
jgi:hypothetical protein